MIPEITLLKKELKKRSKEINDIRNKKIATSDMGKRIQFESQEKALNELIRSLRKQIDEIESDPNYIPEPEKRGFLQRLGVIFS